MDQISEVVLKLKRMNKLDDSQLIRNYLSNSEQFNESFICHAIQLSGRLIRRDKILSISRPVFAKNHEIFFDRSIQKVSFELIISKIISGSDSRSWEVFKAYVIYKNETLQTLADYYGITRERIRQIIKKIKERNLNNYMLEGVMAKIYNHLLNISPSNIFFPKSLFENDEYVFWGNTNCEIYENLSLMAYLLNKRIVDYAGYYILFDDTYKTFDSYIYKRIYSLFEEGKLYKVGNIKDKFFINGIPKDYLNEWILKENQIILYNNNFFYLDKKLSKVDKCRFVLLLIGKPAHFSEVHKVYSKVFKDGTSEHLVHATMHRGNKEGIVRTFNGKYGLRELGECQQLSIQDIAIKILETEKKEYDLQELISEILKSTEAKEKSVLATIITNDLFLVTKESSVILRSWEEEFDVEESSGNTFNEQGLIEDYVYLKYTINEFTIKYNRIRIPSGFEKEIKPYVTCSFCEDEVLLKYDSKYRLLFSIDKFINKMSLSEGDSFYMVFRKEKFYILSSLSDFSIDGEKELNDTLKDADLDGILQKLFGGYDGREL